MQYCLVVNGSIGAPASLPRDYQNVSNFHLLPPSELARYGWYPIKPALKPSYNEQTHRLVETLTLVGMMVNQSWSIVQMTPAEQLAFATARMEEIGVAITQFLNATFARKRYENHVSARAVASSANPVWSQEGREAIAYYDLVWNAHTKLALDLQAGTATLPTVAQFLAQFPPLWGGIQPPPTGNGTSNGTLGGMIL